MTAARYTVAESAYNSPVIARPRGGRVGRLLLALLLGGLTLVPLTLLGQEAAPGAQASPAASAAPGTAPAAPMGLAEAVKAIRVNNPARRAAAQKALVAAGVDAVRPLIEAADSDLGARAAAAVLARIGKAAWPATLALLDDAGLRERAGDLLANGAGAESEGLFPDLLACLLDKPEARQYCGMALVHVTGPKSGGRATALLDALKNLDPAVRQYAALTLGRLGRGARPAVPALAEALNDSSALVRGAAASALGGLGRTARVAVPGLAKTAKEDENPAVRRSAVQALGKVHGE